VSERVNIEDHRSGGSEFHCYLVGAGWGACGADVHKNTRIGDRAAMEFRAEVFNAFNHAQFMNINGDIGGNLDQITSARDAQIGQVALKFSF
jgi:hypothetical protein